MFESLIQLYSRAAVCVAWTVLNIFVAWTVVKHFCGILYQGHSSLVPVFYGFTVQFE